MLYCRHLRLFFLAGLLLAATSVRADEQAETLQTAIFLLRNATQVQPDGQHHVLLRALRQLHDPDLAPLFTFLLDSDNIGLKIHGFLGLAEGDPKQKLDLAQLAQVKDPKLQAEMISAAMDSDLLTNDQGRQAVTWPDLDITVRLLVATQLLKAGEFHDLELLKKAAGMDNIGRQGLAGLMLLQLGDQEGLAVLQRLDKSTDPRRDEVRRMVLDTAYRFDMDKCGGWAVALAHDANLNSRLRLQALQVALRFAAPGATALWQQMYAAANDPAQKTRLSLLALYLSPWLEPAFFTPLLASDDATLKAIGAAATAVAAKKDVVPAVAALVKLQNPLAAEWALRYAKKHAAEQDTPPILLAIIQAYDGPPRNIDQRFDDAVLATEVLVERVPKQAGALLQPILTSSKTDPKLTQAILLGLVRSRGNDLQAIITQLPRQADPDIQALVLLLNAKNDARLTAQQLSDLTLLVRSPLPPALRIQAAWTYVKRTNQAQAVLGQVLGK